MMKMAHILSLNRNGEQSPATYGIIDGLTYQYLGNQLINVDDSQSESIGIHLDFKDQSEGAGTEYYYDLNGNMISDANKQIDYIKYNYLNLPEKVVFLGGNHIKYVYDAAGVKLEQKVYADGGNNPTKVIRYIGEFIYESDDNSTFDLQLVQHEEGRIVPGADTQSPDWKYEYHLKDHLGNVKMTFTSEPRNLEIRSKYGNG